MTGRQAVWTLLVPLTLDQALFAAVVVLNRQLGGTPPMLDDVIF